MSKFKNLKHVIFFIIIVPVILFSQVRQFEDNIIDNYEGSENFIPSNRDTKYITDENGILRMYVEIWGEINRPGTHLVYEGIDLITFFSACGGPVDGADLSEVKILRQKENSKDRQIKTVNLKKVIETGNQSESIILEPNDVVIVKEKLSHKIFSSLDIVSTSLQMLTLYFQIEFYRSRLD